MRACISLPSTLLNTEGACLHIRCVRARQTCTHERARACLHVCYARHACLMLPFVRVCMHSVCMINACVRMSRVSCMCLVRPLACAHACGLILPLVAIAYACQKHASTASALLYVRTRVHVCVVWCASTCNFLMSYNFRWKATRLSQVLYHNNSRT